METSISMKTLAQDGSKNTTTLSYVNPNASDANLKQYAQKLAALTDDTYQGSTKIEKTDLDNPAVKASRDIALWKSDDGGYEYVTVQAAMSNADKGKWFDVRYNGNDPCYVNFGENGAQFKAEVYGGASVEGSAQYAGVSWLLDATRPFGTGDTSNATVTVQVPETEAYEAAELQITVTGG